MKTTTVPRGVLAAIAAGALTMACGAEAPSADGQPAPGDVGTAQASLTLHGATNTWQWYTQADGVNLTCLDGSKTGIGINMPAVLPGVTPKVLLWLDGGGACYDQTTCNTTPGLLTSGWGVARVKYGASDFSADQTTNTGDINAALPFNWSKPALNRGMFDRTNNFPFGITNPFANYAFVFVPYCSGDFFAGSRNDATISVPGGTAHFQGSTNFHNVVNGIYSIFKSTPAIVFAGGSAGGVGTVFDYQVLRAKFTNPTPPITVVSDSGPIFATGRPTVPSSTTWNVDKVTHHGEGFFLKATSPEPVASYVEDLMASAWNLAATVPANVTQPPLVLPAQPTQQVGMIYPMQSVLRSDLMLPNSDRFGFIVGNNDWLAPGILHMDGPQFAGFGVPDNLPTTFPNVNEAVNDLIASFVVAGSSRVSVLDVVSTVRPVIQLRQWNEHHGHMADDVSVWGPTASNGSGLYSYLTGTLGITP